MKKIFKKSLSPLLLILTSLNTMQLTTAANLNLTVKVGDKEATITVTKNDTLEQVAKKAFKDPNIPKDDIDLYTAFLEGDKKHDDETLEELGIKDEATATEKKITFIKKINLLTLANDANDTKEENAYIYKKGTFAQSPSIKNYIKKIPFLENANNDIVIHLSTSARRRSPIDIALNANIKDSNVDQGMILYLFPKQAPLTTLQLNNTRYTDTTDNKEKNITVKTPDNITNHTKVKDIIEKIVTELNKKPDNINVNEKLTAKDYIMINGDGKKCDEEAPLYIYPEIIKGTQKITIKPKKSNENPTHTFKIKSKIGDAQKITALTAKLKPATTVTELKKELQTIEIEIEKIKISINGSLIKKEDDAKPLSSYTKNNTKEINITIQGENDNTHIYKVTSNIDCLNNLKSIIDLLKPTTKLSQIKALIQTIKCREINVEKMEFSINGTAIKDDEKSLSEYMNENAIETIFYINQTDYKNNDDNDTEITIEGDKIKNIDKKTTVKAIKEKLEEKNEHLIKGLYEIKIGTQTLKNTDEDKNIGEFIKGNATPKIVYKEVTVEFNINKKKATVKGTINDTTDILLKKAKRKLGIKDTTGYILYEGDNTDSSIATDTKIGVCIYDKEKEKFVFNLKENEETFNKNKALEKEKARQKHIKITIGAVAVVVTALFIGIFAYMQKKKQEEIIPNSSTTNNSDENPQLVRQKV